MDKELLEGFVEESGMILEELTVIVERLEEGSDEFPSQDLKDFAQKIDRIMGAAKTLVETIPGHPGLRFIGETGAACKSMGYHAAALQRAHLVPFFAAFWAETLDALQEVLDELAADTRGAAAVAKHSQHIQKRLDWLALKVAPNNEAERQQVLGMLKKL